MTMSMKQQQDEGRETKRCNNPECGWLNFYTHKNYCDVCGQPFDNPEPQDTAQEGGRMIYVRVKHLSTFYVIPPKQLSALVDEIKNEIHAGETRGSWLVELVEMSGDDFKNLPEFEGY